MNTPRLHPNGFIQYDLPSGEGRMHVWHPDLPVAQIVHTPIHDHTFDFTSRIILGRLTHVTFDFCAGAGPYQLHGARVIRDEDTRLEPLGVFGDMFEDKRRVFDAGDQYSFAHGRFHLSEGDGLTATIMTKTATGLLPFPRIAVPIGVDPDNNFRRHQYGPDKLMRYVKAVTEEIGVAI